MVVVPECVERADASLPGEKWLVLVHQTGLLGELGEGPIGARILALRRDVEALRRLDTALLLAQQPLGWLTGSVPPAVWGVFGGVAAVCLVLGRLFYGGQAILFGLAATPVVLGVLALVLLGWAVVLEVRRRTFLREVGEERTALGRAVHDAYVGLLTEPFVEKTPGGWLVGAPQRLWLALRLRDLRVNRAPERQALTARLAAELERVEAALRSPTPDPAALQVDLDGLRTAFDAAGVPPGGREGERFDAAMRRRATVSAPK